MTQGYPGRGGNTFDIQALIDERAPITHGDRIETLGEIVRHVPSTLVLGETAIELVTGREYEEAALDVVVPTSRGLVVAGTGDERARYTRAGLPYNANLLTRGTVKVPLDGTNGHAECVNPGILILQRVAEKINGGGGRTESDAKSLIRAMTTQPRVAAPDWNMIVGETTQRYLPKSQ